MKADSDDRSTRFALWWVRRYTAGFGADQIVTRRAEIVSDLAEHQRCRELDDWPHRRIVVERLTRLIRGMPADLAWRHEVLTSRCRTRGAARVALLSVASMASMVLGAFHIAFAAYLMGDASLADRRFLGGFSNYADELNRPLASMIAATVIAALGVALILAGLSRPVAPTFANVATIAIAIWSVLWFWLGAWPVGIVAIIGSAADIAFRSPTDDTRTIDT